MNYVHSYIKLLYQITNKQNKGAKMKTMIYLLALSISLMFTACSSNEQDVSPLSPGMEKKVNDKLDFPHQYLQSFDELKNVKVNYYEEKDGITLVINTGNQKIKNMFAVIEQSGKYDPVLVFLGNSEEQKYFIKDINPYLKFNLKIYGNLKDEFNSVQYPSGTVLRNIPVKGWVASEKSVKVSSSEFPSGLVHLYTELNTKAGSLLVFLGKPYSEDFEIPQFGELGIFKLSLFGYSQKSYSESY